MPTNNLSLCREVIKFSGVRYVQRACRCRLSWVSWTFCSGL